MKQPKDHKVIEVDFSGIEVRMAALIMASDKTPKTKIKGSMTGRYVKNDPPFRFK